MYAAQACLEWPVMRMDILSLVTGRVLSLRVRVSAARAIDSTAMTLPTVSPLCQVCEHADREMAEPKDLRG